MARDDAARAEKYSQAYRDWVANGTDRQKELWEIEKRFQGKPEYRAEYMAAVEELQTYVKIDIDSRSHHGRSANQESICDYFATGMKVHTKSRY
jgi:hypothetical protein